MNRWVYLFSEGSKEQKDLLGGKGANLAEMTKLGLPVPTGFTVTTEACLYYLNHGNQLISDMKDQVMDAVEKLSAKTGKKFGDMENPLLVSVRSGSKFSMPGMMDTVLNLGLNDQTVAALASNSQNERFAYDCYRRLLQMFGNVVMGMDNSDFENRITALKKVNGLSFDNELTADHWNQIVSEYKEIYRKKLQREFPQDPIEQLYLAIEAVFGSWNNQRAKTYRRLHDISDDLGTAVNIQEMVFGNFGDSSGTGVVFSRNPSLGDPGLFGEYLINAQGEDVVAGVRTPKPIQVLADELPEQFQQLKSICEDLEKHYQDMQDVEFTIEREKLFILQTRSGKRTSKAALTILLDFYKEGIINEAELVSRIEAKDLEAALHPNFDEDALKNRVSFLSGLAASPGAATGAAYFTAEAATEAKARGERVVLVREETSPEDIEGIAVSEAVITSRGGMTSHAAVVARGMGICSVVGCERLTVLEENKATVGEEVIEEGTILSVDGTSGKIYFGEIPMEEVTNTVALDELHVIWDRHAKIKVRANAETPKDIATGMALGAVGIGLARTEHMFFEKSRLLQFRQLILADSLDERLEVLKDLKQVQKQDFKFMYEAAEGKPTTIRLLDPPLHEFLPKGADEYREVAKELGKTYNEVKRKTDNLAEVNPMLGFRGLRLGVAYPEIYQMQAEAIIEAACEVTKETGLAIQPEIMIPFTIDAQEFARVRSSIEEAIQRSLKEYKQDLSYQIGTMIEIPRACFVADEIAQHADFFSFGTNDLTQMALGLSRDDSPRIINQYMEAGIFADDPFQVLDESGVGALMKLAIERGRQVNPKLKIGICGEAAAHPKSIAFLNNLAIDYISCSPFRIPQAKMTLAQDALKI
ncbi:pyruvate, phosphate dikinase [Enterococcus malodoratus]|uniref:Pyruvate, phosphate dikinase n=1 Tax=Enterococcus malodoratus ATCC 43197 TaxID=1158601 RepID=R2NY05_9ENTE|nr:pyruvate, phosphate dikinase [Enterococcus malodoratus]EOH75903.1 pyruvate, phosphate dikinase [Enterococcus malodoratus ATCC 43197]EOT66572.1 pyruvate, phosphate dikinase [Enterococcus malodoratus ATCC 43197]OJG60948.1 pyruvate, phosphate dikinase [Enterococcus malodoratus]SPW90594.1 pyruvate, phosphate dikinase [Enterococcus malodoratus]STD70175.1 pyruvate, phosphate dikinase [Enterococcus malodoratus]